METLKSLWQKMVDALQSNGVATAHYPQLDFLETLTERVHAIEIKLGIVVEDEALGQKPDILSGAATDPAAGTETDPAAGTETDPAAGTEMVWDGFRHVPAKVNDAKTN